ncbi:MAG TPA: DNA replication/repair protein RecF [Synechococcales bacterium UBA10510]|nr:DNA replication/repair protein RecF [Synechococcales bacterium UBA10510]
MEVQQFRNIPRLELLVEAPRLLVVGSNGEGKSNLLEAVELLGSLRSHRCSSDRDLIRHGQPSSLLRARTATGDLLQLELRRSGGRSAQRNGKPLERQLDLLASLRCVGFSALDLELVRGEPALRRHWLDRVVLQLEPLYGELLSRYGRLLRQRSQLLRRDPGRNLNGAALAGLLDAFDLQMAVVGTRLHRRRARALRRLAPLAQQWQRQLGGGQEALELRYRSGTSLGGAPAAASAETAADDADEATWRGALADQLLAQRAQEMRLGQCTVGPHRDDVQLMLAGQLARRYASAGQQRTLVVALKLAELELVGQVLGEPPLLLLDDVLAELDPQRQQRLLEAVGQGHQCLVSATHVDLFSAGWRAASQVIRIETGQITGA